MSFAMTYNMTSSGLKKNSILAKIILIIDGTNGCVGVTHGAKGGLSLPGAGSYLPVPWVCCKLCSSLSHV